MNVENDFGFVILAPELNIAGLRTTASSIKVNFPGVSYLCIVGDNATEEDMIEFNKFCPTIKAEKTITSLINTGIKKSKALWNYVVVAGNILRYSLLKKYFYFLRNDKDILYAVSDIRDWTFSESTINGIFLSKLALKEIGDLPDEESVVTSKLYWNIKALDAGYKLKGIVGVRS